MPPHPTPSLIIGDVAALERLAGPLRVRRLFPSFPFTCELLRAGGHSSKSTRLLVERRQRDFPRYRWHEMLNGVPSHPALSPRTSERTPCSCTMLAPMSSRGEGTNRNRLSQFNAQ